MTYSNSNYQSSENDEESYDPKLIYCETYKKKLSELYYSLVVGEKKDMLVGTEGDITFFEIRVVARKFIWDTSTQNFKKVVSNPRGKNSISTVNIKNKSEKSFHINETKDSENIREEELVD